MQLALQPQFFQYQMRQTGKSKELSVPLLCKEREISLTKNELKMLSFFLQNPKQILSKTQLLENVFDLDGDFMDENTVAVNIRRLREKIEEDPAAPVYIKNIRGLGYIWNQEVSQ